MKKYQRLLYFKLFILNIFETKIYAPVLSQAWTNYMVQANKLLQELIEWFSISNILVCHCNYIVTNF